MTNEATRKAIETLLGDEAALECLGRHSVGFTESGHTTATYKTRGRALLRAMRALEPKP